MAGLGGVAASRSSYTGVAIEGTHTAVGPSPWKAYIRCEAFGYFESDIQHYSSDPTFRVQMRSTSSSSFIGTNDDAISSRRLRETLVRARDDVHSVRRS